MSTFITYVGNAANTDSTSPVTVDMPVDDEGASASDFYQPMQALADKTANLQQTLAADVASVEATALANYNYILANTLLPALLFSDGSDGTVNFDGTTSVVGATLSGGAYTLTRDVYYNVFTLGAPVDTNGFAVNALQCIPNGGYFTISGFNASGATPAAGTSSGSRYGRTGGGAGGISSGGNFEDFNTVNGGNAPASIASGLGGSGGIGGNPTTTWSDHDGDPFPAGTAGAPTTVTPPAANAGGRRNLISYLLGVTFGFGSGPVIPLEGGGGGGGGAAQTNGEGQIGTGGGGGGGAGVMTINVKNITLKHASDSGAMFRAKGGNGGGGFGNVFGGAAGGGGGGGGGGIRLLAFFAHLADGGAITDYFDVSAGAAGSSTNGPSGVGANGQPGTVDTWVLGALS